MSQLTECSVLTAADIPAVKELWSICFNDTPKFVDWYFREYYRVEDALGIKKNEQLLAAAQVVPYELEIRNKRMMAGYVVGVMTAPEGRHSGYAKSLLAAGLAKMREEKTALSILMPFEGQFYYRYGWSFCYFQQWYQIESQDLACLAAEYGEVQKIEPQVYLPVLHNIYHTMMATRYHGYAYRKTKDWENLLADYALEGAQWFILKEQDNYEGYLLCLEQGNRLVVQEVAYVNRKAYQGLLWYLQQQEKALEIHTGPNDELAYALAKTKEGILQYPFLMARIVDVEQCLQSIAYPVDYSGCVFTVKDEFAAWNNRTYHFAVQEGRALIALSVEEAQLTIDIHGLTMLVMGARTAKQLAYEGHLENASEEILTAWTALWPLQDNYINAYY